MLSLFSCDRVKNKYPVGVVSYELDTTIYDGNYADYNANPDFTTPASTNRNVLIEDFTGHKCIYCPFAADEAHAIVANNLGRVSIATIHSDNTGIGDFQSTDAEYPIDWTCPDGIAIGQYFGAIAGNGFTGNPNGNVSRSKLNGQITYGAANWAAKTTELINANDLKVKLRSQIYYNPAMRGLYLHTDIAPVGVTVDKLKMVVCLIEDSIVGPQKMIGNVHNETYVHKDILRATIDNKPFGRTITEDDKDVSGNYRLHYSYIIPAAHPTSGHVYVPENMHLLIYIRDVNTDEIYQVIEQKIIE